MKSEKIERIVNSLIETTKSGETIWEEKKSIISKNNRKFERIMSVSLGVTRFSMTIKYVLVDNSIELESSPSLFLANTELPGGSICISNDSIILLRQIIMGIFCQDMNPNSDDLDDILDSINRSISINKYRDDKLGGLLN